MEATFDDASPSGKGWDLMLHGEEDAETVRLKEFGHGAAVQRFDRPHGRENGGRVDGSVELSKVRACFAHGSGELLLVPDVRRQG